MYILIKALKAYFKVSDYFRDDVFAIQKTNDKKIKNKTQILFSILIDIRNILNSKKLWTSIKTMSR